MSAHSIAVLLRSKKEIHEVIPQAFSSEYGFCREQCLTAHARFCPDSGTQ